MSEQRLEHGGRAGGIHKVRKAKEEEREAGEDVDNFFSAGGVDFELAFDALSFLQAVADAFKCIGDSAAALQAYEHGRGKQRKAIDVEPVFRGPEGFGQRSAVLVLADYPANF